MKLAIVGSRSFTDYEKMKETILSLVDIEEVELIVSGGAKGADTLAERFAEAHSIPTYIIRPDWDKFRVVAGFKRSSKIVDISDRIVAFWNGTSNGTRFTIKDCERKNKKIDVIMVEDDD